MQKIKNYGLDKVLAHAKFDLSNRGTSSPRTPLF